MESFSSKGEAGKDRVGAQLLAFVLAPYLRSDDETVARHAKDMLRGGVTIRSFGQLALVEMAKRFSGIDPEDQSKRIKGKPTLQPGALLRLMRAYLDYMNVEAILNDDRVLADGSTMYTKQVKQIIENCRTLVLYEKRVQMNKIVHDLGWDLP